MKWFRVAERFFIQLSVAVIKKKKKQEHLKRKEGLFWLMAQTPGYLAPSRYMQSMSEHPSEDCMIELIA